MKQSFQAGVDTLYNKCVSCGWTPTGKTPTHIVEAIQGIYGNRYTEGYNNGRTQGQNDVKGNPNGYGLYNQSQYDNHYNEGYNNGYNNGYNAGYSASALGGFISQQYSLQNSRTFTISFTDVSGIVVICISLGWQYGIGGNYNLSITPNNYELIYKDIELTGGSRNGGYIGRIVIKTNIDTVPNKQFTINEEGINSTIKYYNALVFRAS